MNEKPDVLSDEELHKLKVRRTDKNAYGIVKIDVLNLIVDVAQAQRDADVAWYQGKIKELKEKVDEMNACHEEIVTEMMARMGLAIQQAKEEVAREIFEEIGKNCKGYEDNTVGHLLKSTFWQSLKSKFLEEKKRKEVKRESSS